MDKLVLRVIIYKDLEGNVRGFLNLILIKSFNIGTQKHI